MSRGEGAGHSMTYERQTHSGGDQFPIRPTRVTMASRACHRPIGETESALLDRRLYTADPTQIKFGIDVHMVG